MRSDREKVPGGFTKEQADRAETMEAEALTLRAATDCKVYWPAPYRVCGEIRVKYDQMNGPASHLLWPNANEVINPDGLGKNQRFQGGPMYWSPEGGAHAVVNQFLDAWSRHGRETGYIGYPATNEIVNNDGVGRRQQFTGATFHWKLGGGTYSVGGPIETHWHTLGGYEGTLGYPTSDQTAVSDGVGKMNFFERGRIYWHTATGAHSIRGDILTKWADAGGVTGTYGYPTAEQTSTDGDATVTQIFQRGTITAAGPKINELARLNHGTTPQTMLDTARRAATDVGHELSKVVADALAESQLKILASSGDEDPTDPIPTPRNAGDLFYSEAVTGGADHGHNGMYISDNQIVEADGSVYIAEISGENAIKKRNPVPMSVNTPQTVRDGAVAWAVGKVGSDYSYNFAFNKRDAGSYNCASLIWLAYQDASSGEIDLDDDGGHGVYPRDIVGSPWISLYT